MKFYITHSVYYWILSNIGYAYDIFLWGFMYYAVFLYLLRNGDYKVVCPEKKEKDLLYVASWMMILWVGTTLLSLCLRMTPLIQVI